MATHETQPSGARTLPFQENPETCIFNVKLPAFQVLTTNFLSHTHARCVAASQFSPLPPGTSLTWPCVPCACRAGTGRVLPARVCRGPPRARHCLRARERCPWSLAVQQGWAQLARGRHVGGRAPGKEGAGLIQSPHEGAGSGPRGCERCGGERTGGRILVSFTEDTVETRAGEEVSGRHGDTSGHTCKISFGVFSCVRFQNILNEPGKSKH